MISKNLIIIFFNFFILHNIWTQEKENPLAGIDLRLVRSNIDYGNFAIYDQLNKEVIIDKNEGRIVFIGNSITQGWKNFMPEMFDNQTFINRGISGQTSTEMLVRFRTDVINLKPKVVVILAGTNDIAGNTLFRGLEIVAGNISSMAELASQNNIKVILCSVLPAANFPWRKGKNPDIKIPLLNRLIKDYAQKKGFYYLDYYNLMNDGNNGLKKDYGNDGVHPNMNGYKLMQKMVLDAISNIL
ncbi:MAG: SGNH/GDSL hydrolase family protein [Bacteroidota bacterium]|nr:SGNH/GDSL hydrolase family protein [Bacteroidota bacterium]